MAAYCSPSTTKPGGIKNGEVERAGVIPFLCGGTGFRLMTNAVY